MVFIGLEKILLKQTKPSPNFKGEVLATVLKTLMNFCCVSQLYIFGDFNLTKTCFSIKLHTCTNKHNLCQTIRCA
jgi:hypothetical protein